MNKIIGRQPEIALLNNMLDSKESEFYVVYGRRRVGKTYLIRQLSKQINSIYFELTGQKEGKLSTQLENFATAIAKTFLEGMPIKTPSTWRDAFQYLTSFIRKNSHSDNIIIFFDEIPWLAGPRSEFMQQLDYIWNTEWSSISNLKLIVCGSAASWMLEHFIHHKGGLHNRITGRIHLKAFTLAETQQYLEYRGIHLEHQQILELYMVMGGIPHYLKAIKKGLSATQNINALCFNETGLLFDEFEKLYASLYKNADVHLKLIRIISTIRSGVELNTIIKKMKTLKSGGTLTKRLLELEAAGFIQGFTPNENAKKGRYYRIMDEFTYFYLEWIEPFTKNIGAKDRDSGYWEKISSTPKWFIWAGYAYEAICLKHIDKIRKALGLDQIIAKIGAWRYIPNKDEPIKGAQIDLLFDRADRVITLCEIKCVLNKFTIDKKYFENLQNKVALYREMTNTKKQIFIAMITTHGLTKNTYSESLVHNEVELKDLF